MSTSESTVVAARIYGGTLPRGHIVVARSIDVGGIPRRVDKEALEHHLQLRRQSAKRNPPPANFSELVVWENTPDMLIDKAIKEGVVMFFRDQI